MSDVHVEHPCVDCGEVTLNDLRCRDCEIDRLLELATCQACGTTQLDLKPIGLMFATAEIHGYGVACPWMAL